MEILDLLIKLAEYGPFAALTFALIYYMRKDHRQDYAGVTKRLNEVEDYQKKSLTLTLESSTRVIAENTHILGQVRDTIQKCQKT